MSAPGRVDEEREIAGSPTGTGNLLKVEVST